jgi:hypothetical protein
LKLELELMDRFELGERFADCERRIESRFERLRSRGPFRWDDGCVVAHHVRSLPRLPSDRRLKDPSIRGDRDLLTSRSRYRAKP